MMTHHSQLKKLTLRVDDDAILSAVTDAMRGSVGKPDIICPQLTELKLVVSEDYPDDHNLEWWKDRAAQLALGRDTLRIYGSWDDGKTLELLA